jgi:DNA-binding XRE family transcriptional regulator
MQAHTKTHPTESMVTLRLKLSRTHAEKVKNFVAAIASQPESDSISYEAFFEKHFPGKTEQEITLAGYRYRENLTQQRLADLTGTHRRHISEMEHGKRLIGKENAKKLARVLNCDYQKLL